MDRTYSDSGLWVAWDGKAFVGEAAPLDKAIAARPNRSYVVPASYQTAGVTEEQARSVAEAELSNRIAAEEPGLHFDAVELIEEAAMWRIYRRRCEEWEQRGLVPGAVVCSVDRLDSRIWTESDFDEFWALQRG